MQSTRANHDIATDASTPRTSSDAAEVQRKSALRGLDFAGAESALAPVQRSADGSPPARTQGGAEASTLASIQRCFAGDIDTASGAPVVQRSAVQRDETDGSVGSGPPSGDAAPVVAPVVAPPSPLDARLTTLGLTAHAATLKSGFGADQALTDYIDACGEDAFKGLILDKQLSVANLQANGGAAFYKTFVGCGGGTIAHVSRLDGIDGGSVKGCHDEDTFRGVLQTKQDYEVIDKDVATGAPKLAPIPQRELDRHAEAMARFTKQRDKRDEQIAGTGASKIPVPVAPVAPVAQPAKITVNLERGRVNAETPLTVAGVKKLDYELRRSDNAEWRGGSQTKTTIKDLGANAAHWTSVCNDAIWDSIRKGTFGQSWSGIGGGAQIDGFWNGATEVDTFFFVT